MPKKLLPVRALRTERERSGVNRSDYTPRSRTRESNVRREVRERHRARGGDAIMREPTGAKKPYGEIRKLSRRAERGTRVKRSSVYDTPESYYRGSKGSIRGGYREGLHGETTDRARRGVYGNQNRKTRRQANVKNKAGGFGPRRVRQSDQGARGQRRR